MISPRKNRLVLALPAALVLSLCSCASVESENGSLVRQDYVGTVSDDPRAFAILDLVRSARKSGRYPGVAISVWVAGDPLVEIGLGMADIEQGTPVTPSSVFQIGSLTKSFTSILIAQLAEEGRVDLDAPVTAYLEDYNGPAGGVPIRHLMNHTAGLPNYTDLPTYFPGTRRAVTRDEVRALFEGLPLMFEPGSAFAYSNSGTFILGLIIEAVTGKTYGDVVRERITEPFGMDDTRYGDWRDVVERRVEGYVTTPDGYRNAPVLEADIPFSAGALISTVEDIQTYIDKVHRQNVLGDGLRDILYTRMPFPDGEALAYALGAIGITDWEGRRKIAHAGDIDGFSAYMAYYPEDDVSIVVLTNTRDVAPTAVGLEQKVARLVFGTPRPEPSGVPLTDSEQGFLIGDYDAGRMRVGLPRVGIVSADGGVAAILGGTAIGGPAIPLIHLEGRRFIAAHDDEMEFVFSPPGGRAKELTLRWLGGEIPFERPRPD